MTIIAEGQNMRLMPEPPSQAQVNDSVADFFSKNPPVSQQQASSAVADYLAKNPPAAGQNATDAQVSSVVAAYLKANPPAAGKNATDAQVLSAVTAYLQANPPASGQNATAEQIATAVSAYLKTNPPAPGQSATDAQVLAAVGTYLKANPPAAGKDGIVPIYSMVSGATTLTLQQNTIKVHISAVSDANGNWSVDYTAAKFKSVVQVIATAWKDTDVAIDQVDVRYKAFTLTKATGSVVKGASVTSLLVTNGAPTVTKTPAIGVIVTVEGTI